MASWEAIGLQIRGVQSREARLRRSAGVLEVLALDCRSLAEGDGAGTGDEDGAARTASADHTARTIVSTPYLDVLTRYWHFPIANPGRFKQMITHRLEADLPIPITQLVWGYREQSRASTDKPTTGVLVQAARLDQIQRRLSFLAEMGIHADVVTTEAEGLGALYRYGLKRPGEESSGPEAMILAEADEWLIAVLADGDVRTVRHIPFGDHDPDQMCRQCRLILSAEQALPGLRRLLWCAVPEMAEFHEPLAEELNITVESALPAPELTGPNGQLIDSAVLAGYGPAIGLALAGLFEPEKVVCLGGHERETAPSAHPRIERMLEQPGRWTALAAASIVLAGLVHVSLLAGETKRMRELLQSSERRPSVMTTLEPQIRAMERTKTYRLDVEDIVAELCSRIPDNIVISSLQLTRDHGLVIKGTADDPKKIYELADDLRNSQRFTSVQPGRTEPVRGNTFTITADVAGVTRFSAGGGRGGR